MKERIFQKQVDLQNTAYIPREYVFDTDVLKLKKIISLIWPRRSGKTTYLLQIINTLRENSLLARDQVVYIDFNDHLWGDFNFEGLLKSYKEIFPSLDPIFFFDEIQEVPNMRSGVFFLYNLWYQVFITGSNSKLLSSELSTHFRWKSYEIRISTLSFREFCTFVKVTTSPKTYDDEWLLYHVFVSYLHYGWYPEIAISHGNTALQTNIVKWYKDIMIYKDLIERHKIGNEYVLKYMINKIILSDTKPININKYNNELKSLGIWVNKGLLYDIVDHLQSVFFVDISVPQYRPQWFKKPYIIDTIYQTIEVWLWNLGQKFENVIYHHFKKQYDHISYFSDQSKDIDLVCDNKKRIQVCRELTDDNVKRETHHLTADDTLVIWSDLRTVKHPLHCEVLRYKEVLLAK